MRKEQEPVEQNPPVAPFLVTVREPSVNGTGGRVNLLVYSREGRITGLAGPFGDRELCQLITYMYGPDVIPVELESSHLKMIGQEVEQVLTKVGLVGLATYITSNPMAITVYQKNGIHR